MTRAIDLDDYRSKSSRVFAGRHRGEEVRKTARLNDEDKAEDAVEVVIPMDTFSVNSSFFLGMFGDSIRALGEERFREKYHFKGKNISRVLEDGIREALRTGSPLERPRQS